VLTRKAQKIKACKMSFWHPSIRYIASRAQNNTAGYLPTESSRNKKSSFFANSFFNKSTVAASFHLPSSHFRVKMCVFSINFKLNQFTKRVETEMQIVRCCIYPSQFWPDFQFNLYNPDSTYEHNHKLVDRYVLRPGLRLAYIHRRKFNHNKNFDLAK